MSTITLPNIRVSSDLEIRLKLKDGGVAIDWSDLSNIKASIYSDRQRSLAGRCDIAIDEEDSTILVCRYSANKPQYPGVNRVIVCCTYDGETKTYDKPAFTFVRWTDDQAGQSITIDDPDIDVEITVEDISSSILQEAVEAANSAAERANDAAAAAEHMVDIHTGPAGADGADGKSAYELAVEEGYTGTEEEWLASLHGADGTDGTDGTDGKSAYEIAVDEGFVGTEEQWLASLKGEQGNTGSSVDYPYELVNNRTTDDATKGLSAAEGKRLGDDLTQLEAQLSSKPIRVPVENATKNQINSDGTYASVIYVKGVAMFVAQYAGMRMYIKKQHVSNVSISYLTSDNLVVGQMAPFCASIVGRQSYSEDTFVDLPADCKYLFVITDGNGSSLNVPRDPLLYIVQNIGKDVTDILSSYGDVIPIPVETETLHQIDLDGTYSSTSHVKSVVMPFDDYAGKRIFVKKQYDANIGLSFLTSDNLVVGQKAPFCSEMIGRQQFAGDTIIDVPSDCRYILVITKGMSDEWRTPILCLYDKETDKAEKQVVFSMEKRPYQFETRFRVLVETNQPQLPSDEQFTIDQHLTPALYDDNCVLYLPETYKATGTPTKLIIFCKQGGTKIGAEASQDYYQSTKEQSPILSLPIFGYLISLGYAVLAADGEPDGWLSALNLGESTSSTTTQADLRVSGNYVAVQSTKRAYDHVVKYYNIDTNGAFVFGYSQGGQYAQNVVDLSGIPVLAVAEMAPVCSFQFHQWDLATGTKTIGNVANCTRASRLNIARMFGFGSNITTNSELLALSYADYKQYLVGYDPWTRDMINPFTRFQLVNNIYKFDDGVTVEDVDAIKFAKAPLKIWCAEGDTTLGVDVMKAFIRSIKNGGGVADITIYPEQAVSHRFYEYQQTIGSVTVNGVSYNYTAVAIDIAIWLRSFGGY